MGLAFPLAVGKISIKRNEEELRALSSPGRAREKLTSDECDLRSLRVAVEIARHQFGIWYGEQSAR